MDHGRDLGPYGVLNIRLHAADAIVFLDFSPLRRAWRAIRRSPGRADFRTWLLLYRRRSRPVLRQAIAAHAGDAAVYVLPTPRAVRRSVANIAPVFLTRLTTRADPQALILHPRATARLAANEYVRDRSNDA